MEGCAGLPVNMPDPIHIWSGSAWKHGPEPGLMILAHRLASGPDLFGQNLTQSTRTKLDPAKFSQYDLGCLWKNANWVWKWETGSRPDAFCQNQAWWFLHTGSLPDQMRLAKTWQGHRDHIQVSFALNDPGLLWNNGTESDAGSQIWYIILYNTIENVEQQSKHVLVL